MPDFDDFNLWDDVVHPFFLSVGTYLVSFGLFIAIVIGGIFLMARSLNSAMPNQAASIVSEETSQLDSLKRIEEIRRANETIPPAKSENQTGFDDANGEFIPNPLAMQQNRAGDTEADVRAAQEMIDSHRQAQLESIAGKSPQTAAREQAETLKNLLGVGIPFLLLAGVSFFWGIFYLPAACAVAGYTRSFAAVINPSVGIDTIRRMGADYIKILVMSLILAIAAGGVWLFLALIFSPFEMPGVGNLPAKAVGSFFTFYFSIVFAVILGFALYKNSQKLNLFRG